MSASMAKTVIVTLKEFIVEDFREHPLDTAPWFNSAIYLGAMLFFGVAFWKAVTVAAIILFAIMYNYGRRTLIRGGIIVLFFSLAVWASPVQSMKCIMDAVQSGGEAWSVCSIQNSTQKIETKSIELNQPVSLQLKE